MIWTLRLCHFDLLQIMFFNHQSPKCVQSEVDVRRCFLHWQSHMTVEWPHSNQGGKFNLEICYFLIPSMKPLTDIIILQVEQFPCWSEQPSPVDILRIPEKSNHFIEEYHSIFWLKLEILHFWWQSNYWFSSVKSRRYWFCSP